MTRLNATALVSWRERGSALTFDLRAVIDLHGLLCCQSACSFNWAANIIQLTPGQCIRSKHKTYKQPNTNTHSSGPQANVFWPGCDWVASKLAARRSTLVGWPCKWPESGVLQFCNFRRRTTSNRKLFSGFFVPPPSPRCGLFFDVCKYFCFKLWTSRLQIHSVCMTIFTEWVLFSTNLFVSVC